jgi:hypothetical protein
MSYEDYNIDKPTYQEIGDSALEVLTAYFLETQEGKDNELLLNVLSDNLDGKDLDDLEGEELANELQKISMSLSSMYSGMLIHVVNLIRVIGMMSLQSEDEAYRNYVAYYHTLLPEYDDINSPEEAVQFMDRLNEFFGWEAEEDDDVI